LPHGYSFIITGNKKSKSKLEYSTLKRN